MKKYLIEYIKKIGQPDFIFATELTEAGKLTINRGEILNPSDFPELQQAKQNILLNKGTEFIHEGVFNVVYFWQDFKGNWNKCDQSKYIWCQQKNKQTKINLQFIS